jgi:hypothetical protein
LICRSESVHAGEVVVQKNAVVRRRTDPIQHLVRRLDLVRREPDAGLEQVATHGTAIELVVVHHQETEWYRLLWRLHLADRRR